MLTLATLYNDDERFLSTYDVGVKLAILKNKKIANRLLSDWRGFKSWHNDLYRNIYLDRNCTIFSFIFIVLKPDCHFIFVY